MALTSSQIASRLFKKSLGAGETLVSRQFFEEPRLGNEFVLSNQLWTDSNQIPNTAPSLPSGSYSGVVQYFSLDPLTHVSGSSNLSYFSANLIDSIPFNFGTSGTYNYQLYKNDGVTSIAFGDGDWLVDNSAGLLTFYGTLPSGVSSAAPPKISFFKYIGSKGFPVDSGGTITGITAGAGLSGGGTQGFFTLDVNVNGDSLEIVTDQIRLKDTISGDRIFSDSVLIQGNLTVEGTQSIIYTENIYLQDTIITLNATYSGPYNAVDSGLETNLGGGTYATLIWNSATSLWSAGYSGSVDSLITSAGVGLTKSGDELSLDFANIVGAGLTQNGSIIGVDTSGLATVLAGDGLSSSGGTLSVNVGNGLSIVSDTVYLGGTLSQNTTIDTNTFNLSVKDGLNYITNKISGKSGIAYRIGTDASAGFGIDNGATFDLESVKVVAEKEIVIYNDIDSVGLQPGILVQSDNFARVDFGLGITSTSSVIRILSTSATSSDMLVVDSLSQRGLVNNGDYESNFVDRSLVTKQYVDSIVGSVGATNGLSEIIPGVVGLGGTLSQNTIINSNVFDFTIQDFNTLTLTGSIVDVQLENGLFLVDVGSDGSIDLYGGDAMIFATGSIDLISSNEFAVNTATGSITTSNLKGLIYTSDYSGTFVTNSLISKKYVDDSIASLGSGTIAGVTAGNGLSGGGTSGFISIDVNLGVDSGLTFSGDNIVIDSNIAGNGLDFSSGVLTVNTSEINTALAGNGLTANGSSLDVNVNTDSLEIIGDVIRLKDTITGDRFFQDSLTVQGNLNVTGTVSYIYTENVYIEDNILTLNATWSGSPILNAGIEVIRGNEDVASLIWNETTDLWSAGLSGSEVSILLNAGTGLVKNGATVSLDFTSITGTGLTQNGNQISIDTPGLAGDGLSANGGTLSVNVGNGLSIVSDTVYLGGTLSQNTTIDASNYGLYFQGNNEIDNFVNDPMSFPDIYGQVNLTSQTYDARIGSLSGNTFSRVSIQSNGLILENQDESGSQVAIQAFLTTSSVGDNSSNNRLVVIDDLSQKGLVYSGDYTSNFTTYSLVTKGYVDSVVSSVGATNGLTEINPGVIGLGGDLTQNTTLVGNSYDFVISNVDTLLFTSSVFDIEADSFISLDAGTGSMQLLADKDIDIVAVSGELGLGGLTGLVTISSGEGLVYAGSYSATFVTHSLVDKYYVDQQVSGLGSGTIAGVTAGAGLSGGGTANYITLDVNVANGLVINGDNVEISSSIAGVGLTFAAGVLSVIAGSSQPFYDEFNAVTTTGDDAAITGVTISSTPNDFSRIEVYVNGLRQRIGDNVTNKDCYFGPSPGSAIPLTSVLAGTQLYWNGSIAGFDLSPTDVIEIVYEV